MVRQLEKAPEQKRLVGNDSVNTKVINAMKEMPSSCAKFTVLYAGLQLRIRTSQPDAEMTDILSTASKVWEIHKTTCSMGNLASHF